MIRTGSLFILILDQDQTLPCKGGMPFLMLPGNGAAFWGSLLKKTLTNTNVLEFIFL
jgi:hypothetical protein